MVMIVNEAKNLANIEEEIKRQYIRIRIVFLGYSRIVRDLALFEYAKNRIDYVCCVCYEA